LPHVGTISRRRENGFNDDVTRQGHETIATIQRIVVMPGRSQAADQRSTAIGCNRTGVAPSKARKPD
jgi:hypothetical protein